MVPVERRSDCDGQSGKDLISLRGSCDLGDCAPDADRPAPCLPSAWISDGTGYRGDTDTRSRTATHRSITVPALNQDLMERSSDVWQFAPLLCQSSPTYRQEAAMTPWTEVSIKSRILRVYWRSPC